MTGDINRCDLKLSRFIHRVSCKTRRDETLNLMYCNVPDYESSEKAFRKQ